MLIAILAYVTPVEKVEGFESGFLLAVDVTLSASRVSTYFSPMANGSLITSGHSCQNMAFCAIGRLLAGGAGNAHQSFRSSTQFFEHCISLGQYLRASFDF